jgi:hypothetical protein
MLVRRVSGCCYPGFVREGGEVRLVQERAHWRWKTFGFQQVYGRVRAGFEADRNGLSGDKYEQRSLTVRRLPSCLS